MVDDNEWDISSIRSEAIPETKSMNLAMVLGPFDPGGMVISRLQRELENRVWFHSKYIFTRYNSLRAG